MSTYQIMLMDVASSSKAKLSAYRVRRLRIRSLIKRDGKRFLKELVSFAIHFMPTWKWKSDMMAVKK